MLIVITDKNFYFDFTLKATPRFTYLLDPIIGIVE